MKFPFEKYPILHLEITDKCNQECLFCLKGNSVANFSLYDVKTLVHTGITDKKIKGVGFGGGEPFLYSQLKQAMDFCRKKHLKILITTNGTALTELKENIKLIDNIFISLHCDNESIHNKIVRNENSYREIERTISFLKDSKRKFYINCICNRKNYRMLPGFVENIFDRFGSSLQGLQVFSLKYIGRALKNKSIWLRHSQASSYLNRIDKISRDRKLNVVLRDFPLCLSPQRITAPRYPKNYLGYMKKGEYFIEPVISIRKTHPNKCKKCRLIGRCPGIDTNYLKIYGTKELKPR